MASFLRHINRSKWYHHDGVPWLQSGELQADALADLYTKNNTLSVYYVEEPARDLDRIIAAMAARRNVPTNFDYVLIDGALVARLAIEVAASPGDTPDPVANALHRDLRQLTSDKLLGLVAAIAQSDRPRIAPADVKARLKAALEAGTFDLSRMDPGLRAHLEE